MIIFNHTCDLRYSFRLFRIGFLYTISSLLFERIFAKCILLVLMLLTGFVAHAQVAAVQWDQVHPGIWKAAVGKPESISLLKTANVKPYEKGLASLPVAPFPIDRKEIKVKQQDGKIYLRFPLQKEEKIFGLGLNFQTVNQRGRVLNLHVDHYSGTDNGRTHAPVPFYVSSKGYGVLIDAARYLTVYAGTGVRKDSEHPPVLYNRNTDKNWDPQPYSDAVEILVPADGAEIYVFAGPTPMNAVQRYNLLNGGGYLPPKWGLGFTQRVPTLYNQDDILKEASEFEKHNFPLSFIGVEPGWQNMAYPCTFEWDSTRFPDPKALVDSLSKKGITLNLWLNPYVSPKSSVYDSLKNISGSHTVWNGIVPDLFIKDARVILKRHFLKNHLDIGIGGYKIDEVDGFDNWLWPDLATFPSGFAGEQMRQVYGFAWQSMTAGWFRERNTRTYGLVRASNAGASSMPYVIYNDYYSHRDFITALINSSFIGVLWTPEVRSSENAEEWVRRVQTVCFSPMAMINAWADGTKPWSYPEVEKAVRDVAFLRMQLLPYIYSTFAQYHFYGIPPFRAMNLVEGFAFQSNAIKDSLDASRNPYAMSIGQDIKDQYMMGDNLLVAPMFAGQSARKVYLPEGKWYDFYTGKLAGGNQVIEVNLGIDKIPLFVKDGGIIPMIPERRTAPSLGEKLQLIVRHYGESEGNYMLYDDDGVSFNYEKGIFSLSKLIVHRDKYGKLNGSVSKLSPGKPFGYKDEIKWEFMTE
jgi:alpha-D-xyloside xylohydrolase